MAKGGEGRATGKKKTGGAKFCTGLKNKQEGGGGGFVLKRKEKGVEQKKANQGAERKAHRESGKSD